jgi:hypothetical protein
MSYKRVLLIGNRDLINLSHFDPIIRMVPLTMIPLSRAHCIKLIILSLHVLFLWRVGTKQQSGTLRLHKLNLNFESYYSTWVQGRSKTKQKKNLNFESYQVI